MMDAIQKISEEALEFPQIRRALSQLCQTESGSYQVMRETPYADLRALQAHFSQLSLLDTKGWHPPLRIDPLSSLDELLAHAARSKSMLSLPMLARVRQMVDYYQEVVASLEAVLPDSSLFLPVISWEPLQLLCNLISPEGELQEDKDPQLRQILSAIHSLQRAITTCAERIMHQQPECFTSDLPTLKNDRLTLPLSVKYRSRISGILLSVSDSGTTLFIEPAELLDLNNQLVAKKKAHSQRVQQILQMLTESVRLHADTLAVAENALAKFDVMAAKFQWGQENATAVVIPSGNELLLSHAIHPLFSGKFSPLEISLSDRQKILVLSGPNAGGKTVFLKTAGLLTLMAHYGIPVTADPESQIPYVRKVYCVLGDSQSLAQSLSSFSGRLTQLATILGDLGKSLVIIDELGNDTDPQEGSALSCAFLDAFLQAGVWVMVSTHLHLVKVYAMQHPDILCAAMGFNEDRHAPDYRLIMDHVGLSHAFDSARHCGISPQILAAAQRYLNADDPENLSRNFSRLLDEYQSRSEALAEEQERVVQERTELQLIKGALHAQEREMKKSQQAFLRSFRKDATRKLDELVKELKVKGNTEQVKSQVKEFKQGLAAGIAASLPEPPPMSQEIQEGVWVRFIGGTARGKVQSMGKAGAVEVVFGQKRVKVSANLIEACAAPSTKAGSPAPQLPPTHSATITLDVRGQRLFEVISRVQHHLQQAVLAGLPRAEVIHGVGEGILRRGLREFFHQHALVERWEEAAMDQGGAGKTIVFLVQ